MRYLDSRKDEQERGITMKSSAVTLLHRRGTVTQYTITTLSATATEHSATIYKPGPNYPVL